MQEFLAILISFFLIEPLESAMADRFGNASRENVAAIAICIRDATPVFIQQASNDPWKAATNVLEIWTGMTPPEEILASATPGCADAVSALRVPDGEAGA